MRFAQRVKGIKKASTKVNALYILERSDQTVRMVTFYLLLTTFYLVSPKATLIILLLPDRGIA